jgi:hypothetical protein
MLPQLSNIRGQQRLGNVDQLPHKRFRLWAKREIDPTLCAEQIRHHRITAAFHTLEQQRRSTLTDDTSMDLGQFEVWINLGSDGNDFVFSGESIEKCAQAGVHRQQVF